MKNYRVSAIKNFTPNVVTALLNIVLKSDALPLAQYVESLKPIYWEGNRSEEEIQSLMWDFEACTDDFRVYLYNYITDLFQFLSESHDMDSVIKSLIENLNQSEMPKKCDNFNKLHDSHEGKCTDCGGKVLNRDLSHTFEQPAGKSSTLPKYFNVGECSRDNSTDRTMGSLCWLIQIAL